MSSSFFRFKGVTVDVLFRHFDKDNGGTVSVEEFSVGLKKIKEFNSLTDEDIEGLVTVLDSDKSGDISLQELVIFAGQQEPPAETKSSISITEYAEKLRNIFRAAEKKGMSVEQAFSHVDVDHSGELAVDEFELVLKRFRAFKTFSREETSALMKILDTDNSGQISLQEFRDFVDNQPSRAKSKMKGGRAEESKAGGQNPKDSAFVKEMVIRHLKRISQADGSIEGLLAYLDDDEDGLISVSSILRLFRREGVFEAVNEQDVMKVLDVAMKGDLIVLCYYKKIQI